MDRTAVSSSNIASIGYDSDSGTLEVEFTNGKVYQYFNVPPDVAARLLAAPSIGRFFNSYVRETFTHIKL
ncbi:MAG: KTSC domain-containing protein [Acidobacteriia bacterium]|nr:KTSC domain-containing protein [Terriglobia bacterium]